jgi:segregation and condensation protein B
MDITENVVNEDIVQATDVEETAVKSDELSDGSEKAVGRAAIKEERRARKNAKEEEVSEQAAEPVPEKMSSEKAMRVLEAILFANGDEVYYDQFAKIIGYTTKEAIKIVDTYALLYDTEAFPRGVRLIKYDKCCQLSTYPELGEYVTQMIGIRGEPQLSAAAMETLAIVAYNQPVTRAYIEQVRRVDSTRPITVLLDRELIEEKGRLDVIGRPRLFGTTQNFLKTFGISSLEELPSLDLFSIDG